jgi:hypothetical protein
MEQRAVIGKTFHCDAGFRKAAAHKYAGRQGVSDGGGLREVWDATDVAQFLSHASISRVGGAPPPFQISTVTLASLAPFNGFSESFHVRVWLEDLKVGHGHFHMLCNSKIILPFDDKSDLIVI